MAKKSAEKPKIDSSEQPTISKTEAVRKAIAEGLAGPVEGIAYIKTKFGIDVSPSHFSAIKAGEKKKAEEPMVKTVPQPKSVSAGKPAPTTAKKASAGEPDVLAALENVKELVDQFGADKLKRMVDLLR